MFSEHYQPYGWLCTNRNNTFLDKKYCRTCERNSKYPIIHCIKWWIDNTNTVQIVSQFWLSTNRCQWIYATNLHFYVQAIMFKIPIWTAPCTILIFHTQKNMNQYQRKKIPALFYVKLTSTASHSPYSQSAIQYVWILLQRSSLALDRVSRFPQDNLESSSCMTLMKL